MLKKILFSSVLFLFLISPAALLAHSGGTDGNGGHHCRTDCEKYGYEYGEYHYHNSRSQNETNYMGYIIVAGIAGFGVWFFMKDNNN